ncbi:hypothetical protein PAEPH01_1240 [Pancytospora epiphaga]|nr:hypothetical protein PAEPH01_1240 [Pancytospora epiphaga]
MFFKYKLVKIMTIVSMILGSQESRNTALDLPLTTNSDPSKPFSHDASNTETNVVPESLKIAENSELTPSATVGPSDELPPVANILKNAGFNVCSLKIVDDTEIIDDQLFETLIEHVRRLLKEHITIIDKALGDTTKAIGMLRQGIIPGPREELNKNDLRKEPKTIEAIHKDILTFKLNFYVTDSEALEDLNITKETWEEVFQALEKIKQLVKVNDKSDNVIIEPFEKDVKPKKSFYMIARLLASIDQIVSTTTVLCNEYYKRCEDLPSTANPSIEDLNRKAFLSLCSETLVKITKDALNMSMEKLKIVNIGEANMGLRQRLFINDLMIGIQKEVEFMTEKLVDMSKPLVGDEYLEYLLYCEERLKGVVDALERIQKEVNDISKAN